MCSARRALRCVCFIIKEAAREDHSSTQNHCKLQAGRQAKLNKRAFILAALEFWDFWFTHPDCTSIKRFPGNNGDVIEDFFRVYNSFFYTDFSNGFIRAALTDRAQGRPLYALINYLSTSHNTSHMGPDTGFTDSVKGPSCELAAGVIKCCNVTFMLLNMSLPE